MAELIRQHLENIGKTQAEFCREVGVSTKHLNSVLTGRATARTAALDYWAWVLGMRFDVTLQRR